MSSLPTWQYPESGGLVNGEILGGGESDSTPTTYLPAECQAAIDATNQKYDDMKEVWNNYISNLRNGENLVQLQSSLNHIQNITDEHLEKHNALRRHV